MSNDWQRVTDPMNPPTKDYILRVNGGFVGAASSAPVNDNLKSAKAHAEALRAALMDEYKAQVNGNGGMAVYAVELVLREAVKTMNMVNELCATAEPEGGGK